MPTPFEQIMQQLRDAEGDSDKLALITFDFTVGEDAELKAAAEAAAVPHWFDEAVLVTLLPERAAEAVGVLEALKKLPMVETYPMEDRSPAWNLHEATRNALRRRMWETDLPRFRELSQRAADHFGDIAGPLEETKEGVEKKAPWRIEALCHRLLAQPVDGAYEAASFVHALLAIHRPERLQAIAALLTDLVDGPWGVCAEAQRAEDARQWARAQYNLGIALADLGECVEPLLGNRLLEQSVCAYRAALEVRTRGNLPQDWAMTQNNLGNALYEQGIRREGPAGLALLAEAVAAFRAVMEFCTRESLPRDWALTQNNLGNALRHQGSRSEGPPGLALLAEAVAAYRAALEVRTRKGLPQGWALTQNNLGNALLAQGIRSEGQGGFALLAEAVAACRAALEVYTRENLPQSWAATQNNLGNAFTEQGIRSEGQAGLDLLAEAVAAHRAALEVRSRDSLPQYWAMTQTNLAIALRHFGVRSEGGAGQASLAEAVAAYRAALEVRTRESLPQDWAMTQNNLGVALMEQGDKANESIEKRRFYQEAEAAYLLALEVRTAEALPYYHQATQKNLDQVRARLEALGES